MANKRTLKKAIKLICGELFSECVAASLYGLNNNKENDDALLFSVLKLESDFLCRVSHPEPGLKPAAYYKDLREKFAAQVDELVDQINHQ